MANRTPGINPISFNFEIEYKGPIDGRMATKELAHLTNTVNDTQTPGDGSYLPFPYLGMVVSVTEDPNDSNGDINGVYVLKTEPHTDINNWEKVGSGSNQNNGIYNSNLDPVTTMVDDHGGLPAGTTAGDLSGIKTYDELFDAILFPTSYPTYTQPSVSLASVGSYFTIGEEVDVTLTTGASRGLINNIWDGTNQGPYAGEVISAAFIQNGGGSNNLNFVDTDIDDTTISQYAVQSGSNEWELIVGFDNGIDPVDSTGAIVQGGSYVSGTKSASRSFQGSLPIFLGNVSDTYDQRTLDYAINGNNIECNQSYPESSTLAHRIKIPVDLIGGRTLTIQYYNSLSPANPWQTYGNPSTAWIVTTENINLNSNNTTVPYLVYTKDLNIHQGDGVLYRLSFS
jgi:hypothetical protein